MMASDLTPEHEDFLGEVARACSTFEFSGRINPELNKELTELSIADLYSIPSYSPWRLFYHVAATGLGRYISRHFDDQEFLTVTGIDGSLVDYEDRRQFTVLDLVAEHPFPVEKFPYHLIEGWRLDSELPDGTTLVTRLASATSAKQVTLDHLPICHLDLKWLTPQRLLNRNKDGFSALYYLLRSGQYGQQLIRKTSVLDAVDPSQLVCPIYNGQPHLFDILLAESGCQLIAPARFKNNLEEAFAIGRECIMIHRAEHLSHGDLDVWIAEIAKLRLAQSANRKLST